ncbi:ArdC family protein [Azospirillum rugosum]|uniref:Antirestriction protein ArdC n=1 Tax=Azospirillum rugosum TaxID=416170 RepID=A0ABS4SK80_9PROT|nr:zincin-like metallopeptidase domain-containing protein [Azospirillum rugosum]MBP2292967.1 antirestriction protein ArdC [Azospirillum rugosum]MDQ0526516.1 antirestriction protein ArdC [Azospirillum rugosum]
MATLTQDRTDVYTRVTERIVADLEKGVRPWMKPWDAGNAAGRIARPLRAAGQPYRGINTVMLWMTAMERGYASPFWLSYRQAQELGGQVRRGEHGTLVVYAGTVTRPEQSGEGEESEREIRFLKGYTVFNAEQVDGLPDRFRAPAPEPKEPMARIEAADRFFAATGAEIRTGGTRAYYAIGSDHIQMPPFETFRDAESFAATLGHETVHWTRHPSRLARDLGRKRWGDEGYAAEELVAEIGSAFLCADLGITPEVREDHAAYIASWLEVLRNDKRFIVSAAAHAQRAVDYLHELQPPVQQAA